MPYVTLAEFALAFGEQESDELVADGPTFVAAETKASALVDGYVAAKYSLPLANVPAIVKGWTLDIARFFLWEDRAPEEVRSRYDLAVEQLRDLARGVMKLPPDVNAPQASGFATAGFSAERVFTSDTLAGY